MVVSAEKAIQTFSKCICLKMNKIARMEFEFAYYDDADQSSIHYITETPQIIRFPAFLLLDTCSEYTLHAILILIYFDR